MRSAATSMTIGIAQDITIADSAQCEPYQKKEISSRKIPESLPKISSSLCISRYRLTFNVTFLSVPL
jgi:hypothetical protein